MKVKKGFNWKARQVVTTEINNSGVEKIELDPNFHDMRQTDENNVLVLPSKKQKTKTLKECLAVKKILSKKQRKELQKVLDRKKKKENRASVLMNLSSMAAPAEITKLLPSIAAVYSKTKKSRKQKLLTKNEEQHAEDSKYQDEEDSDDVLHGDAYAEPEGKCKLSCVKGSNKRRKLLSQGISSMKNSLPPNTITFQSSSEDDDDDDSKEGKDEGGGGSAGDVVEAAPVAAVESNLPGAVEGQPEVAPVPDSSPAVYVHVYRPPDVQEARLKLPVLAEEQVIMEAVRESPVVVLAGETGSGKTTQVPQFLYEAGYARNGRMIAITEPRRVAATSMSMRVAQEMSLSPREVSYLIRFEGNASEDTKIKFMTDGVLLKEIQQDFLLSKYSVVILDEAHERTVHTDILIGLLSRISILRSKRGDPLKLIIMSATLRLDDFTANRKLFRKPPPVIKVEGRQFPVTVHFSKHTDSDYVTAAYKKACRIHTQLPDGGIIIFLTGQQEVKSVVRKLRRTFPVRRRWEAEWSCGEDEVEGGRRKTKRVTRREKWKQKVLAEVRLEDYPAAPYEEEEEGWQSEESELADEEADEVGVGLGPPATRQPVWALPLYALLPSSEQAKVFKPPPDGCRLCVVATNVAETSLTIPNIKYVVDSGRVKARLYDKLTGLSMFVVKWASKASADQRAGRAGRVGPGHCYRLYSSAMFNNEFEAFEVPEIQRKPVDDLVLQMKAMNIHIVVNFPFPSPIDPVQLAAAERRLLLLGALHKEQLKGKSGEWSSRLTQLGRTMAAFPVAPRFAKMLALGHQHGLLPYVVCVVAALSVQEVLLLGDKEMASGRRRWAGAGNSFLLGDVMVVMGAIGAAEHAHSRGELPEFCRRHGLRPQAVMEVHKLRRQLSAEVSAGVPGLQLAIDPNLLPPSDAQALLLRQVVLAGLVDQVARRVDPSEVKDDQEKLKWKRAYRCEGLEEPAFLHPSSVLFRKYPDWVVYQEVFETKKQYLRGVTAIEPQWLPRFAPALCSLSSPLLEPPPRFDQDSGEVLCHVTGTFGRSAWELPMVEVPFPPGLDAYKWFARFLLEGAVCPALQKFRPKMLSSPATMVKTWANLQSRTCALLNALRAQQVCSRATLLQAWEKDRTYLLSAVQQWLPETAHSDIAAIWPPV